jgi:hypothetical protein
MFFALLPFFCYSKKKFSEFTHIVMTTTINVMALVSSSWRLETLQYKRFNKASEFEASPPKLMGRQERVKSLRDKD